MNGGGSSLPEVQRLLAVLARAARGRGGTAFGEGAEAMARTAHNVGSVELEADRAAIAAERLEPLSNVELLVGDWRELLPPRAPFGLFFLDAGGFKHAPHDHGERVLGLLESVGGLLVMDDMTPDWPGFDPVREWSRAHPRLSAAEGLTTPTRSALLIARLYY